MGAYPGPAAYGFGSSHATLVDALLVAGWMNPNRFLGGRRQLRTDLAEAALQRDVAEPLAVDLDMAAARVIERAAESIAEVARKLDGDLARTRLFAFGGNGANLAVPLADALSVDQALVFRLGPVFSAFGSSVSQVRHVAEAWPTGNEAVDAAALEALVDQLRERVILDVAGEGFDPRQVSVEVELLVDGQRKSVGTSSGAIREVISGDADDRSRGVAVTAPTVEQVTVTATAPVARYEPPFIPGPEHMPAYTGSRRVLHGGQRREARLYDWDHLGAGAHVEGPAVLEGAANTCTVPPSWGLEVDGYGNAILRRTS